MISEPTQPNAGPNPEKSAARRFGLPVALVTGGLIVGSVLAPIGLASAQDSASSSDAIMVEHRDGEPGPGHRGLGDRGAVLEELLGLSRSELRAAFEEGQTLADIAEANGVSTDELVAALVGEAESRIDEAVADGRLDATEAEERLADVSARIAERVNGGPGTFEGHRGQRVAIARDVLDELGISVDDLKVGRERGQTLVETAAEAGVSEDALVTALVDAAEADLDERVAGGILDEDRAAEMRDLLTERITERVNAEPGERGPGRR